MDAGFGAELPAEIAMMLGIVAFVGEHGPDPRHDGEGGQEQPLEHQSVVDVGCGGRTGDGHAVARDVVLGAPFAPVSWVGPGQITQFALEALCWVHAERLIHKLDTFTDQQYAAQQRLRALVWWFYADLKAYRRDPRRRAALRARFDRIFRRRTGFATLDRLLDRL